MAVVALGILVVGFMLGVLCGVLVKKKTTPRANLAKMLAVLLVAMSVALALGYFVGRSSPAVFAWEGGGWQFRQEMRAGDPRYVGELIREGDPVRGRHGEVTDTPLGKYRYEMREDQYSSGGWYPHGASAKGIHFSE